MDVIGIVPTVDRTFEICGDMSTESPVEGKLYYDPSDKRLYYYSQVQTRSNPTTGYFPIWNGATKIITSFSKEKYLDKDGIMIGINSISDKMDKSLADQIKYQQRKSCANDVLTPPIVDGDNMFTQCIKGVITSMNIAMVDLIDMGSPKMSQRIIESYYSALNKITFMRYDKWVIWINSILHVNYVLTIIKNGKNVITYQYPSDKIDTGTVKYDNLINEKDDPFKKIVKLLIVMENISKSSLRGDSTDDYTINNMMTTINSSKPLSAQLFSRFIRMAGMSCVMSIYKHGELLFEYKE